MILSVLVLAITFILSINFIPSKVILKEGEVAPRDIVAPETIEFIDEEATEKLKVEAIKSTREVYNLNLSIIENVENELENFFADVRVLRTRYSIESGLTQGTSDLPLASISEPSKDELENIISKYSLEFDQEILLDLTETDLQSLEEIEKNIRLSVRKIMQQGVKEEDTEEAKKQFVREVSEISSNTHNATIASEVGKNFIKPSLFLDVEATEKKVQDSIAAVRDVKNIIRKDQIIIRKGEIVTSNHIDQLKLLGLQNPILHLQNILGLLLMNTLFIFLLSLYIKIFNIDIYNNINKLILLSILYCLTVFVAKVAGEISGYLIPIAFGSMLIAITIDSRLALWTTFMLSFNIGFIFLGEINFMIVALIGGIVSVFSIRKATQRSSLTRAGLLIALANALSIFALGLVHRYSSQIILENCLWGILSGIISTILTIGVLPFLESIFDISSSFRLMELANPNQPLLKQLLVEAPGTYHHSVIVGNLAETAAEEIGANSLLARVGAYYHDIGKLKRPYFFAENQEAYKNTHDDMEPSLSALVIASHVKDGVEMTKKYRLPKAVIDIINQHHGTGLISYFFHRALQSNESKTTTVNEGNYRYSGPKPQSKEAGIIMLADMLEAEARTLNSPTPSRIKNLVQNVISRNLENGQLDDCNLTLRDLNKIKEIFSRILTGMFHNRVEYPDEELINKLKKERSQGESTSKKSTEATSQSNGNKKNIDNGNEIDESEGQ
ncbi:MAG: HDIG domain-containing protein, partial [Candidatus Atribacteria bacterium]|nr:HDIG domain-containing protein [Candidatus Atribacteria bacterium]